jgi:hypothetical protein
MLGFEVNINGNKSKATLAEGVTTILIDLIRTEEKNEMKMSFSGFDHKLNERYIYLDSPLNISDQIIVTVKNIEENSEPLKVIKINPEESIIDGKLRAYRMLKQELERDGLI